MKDLVRILEFWQKVSDQHRMLATALNCATLGV
jgi:hypothetical protein